MALPASGELTLEDFNVELSKTAGSQIALNDQEVRDMIGKASGDEASFSDYYGASAGGSVVLPNISDLDEQVEPDTATASITIFRNGNYGTRNSGNGDWWSAAPETGIGDDYEFFVSVTTGNTPSGFIDNWVGITSNRTWQLETSSGALSCTLAVSVRDATTQTVVDTATWTLQALSEP